MAVRPDQARHPAAAAIDGLAFKAYDDFVAIAQEIDYEFSQYDEARAALATSRCTPILQRTTLSI